MSTLHTLYVSTYLGHRFHPAAPCIDDILSRTSPTALPSSAASTARRASFGSVAQQPSSSPRWCRRA